jgi:hypothetical protein
VPEQFTNDAICQLAANLGVSDNSMTVTAPLAGSPPFPATGTFRVKIASSGEFIRVQGVSGLVWDITNGRGDGTTTPAAAPSGTQVEQVLTKEALLAAFARIDQANTSPIIAPAFQASGVGAFTNPGRFLGIMTVPGPPPSGFTYNAGDWGYDSNGLMWLCTAGGNPGTWVPPAGWLRWNTQTLTTNQPAISITMPTAGFSHATVILSSRTTGGAASFEEGVLRFNGDSTGAHYANQRLNSNDNSPQGFEGLSLDGMRNWFTNQNGDPSGIFGFTEISIPNFLDTTRNKRARVKWDIFASGGWPPGTGTMWTAQTDCWWISTAAIATMTLTPGTNQWLAGTKADTYVMA